MTTTEFQEGQKVTDLRGNVLTVMEQIDSSVRVYEDLGAHSYHPTKLFAI